MNIGLDADGDEVKKAYKRLSLLHHPDKVQAAGRDMSDANERFNEIKAARDILQDPERRKIYDTFGVDLGEERPEMEFWTIGMSSLLSPMGMFTLRTVLMRLVIWIVGFKWIGWLLLVGGVVVAVLYAVDFKYKEYHLRSPEAAPLLMNIGIIVAVVLICWVWQLLADAVGIFYLVSEVVDLAMFFENWKLGVIAAVASFLLAWLVRGWWFWIIGIEFGLALVMLVALTVGSGLMGLWIESIKTQHGDKLKESRLRMRRTRKALQQEVDDLKKKLQDYERRDNGAAVSDSGRRPGR